MSNNRRVRGRLFSARFFILFACMMLAGLGARSGQIESLLTRGLPTSIDPAVDIQRLSRARDFPLKPLVRKPFYGLPYDLVETTTGRLILRVDDLALPGRIPIVISRVSDSGMSWDSPTPPQGQTPRYEADLGPRWALTIAQYLQEVSGGYVLVDPSSGPVKFVPSAAGSSEYIKEQEFASNHQKLFRIDTPGNEIHESRADGTTWEFHRLPGTSYLLLTQVQDRHGNTLDVTYDEGGLLMGITNSDGSWVSFSRDETTHLIISITDSAERTLTFEYDGSGTLISWSFDRELPAWEVLTDTDSRIVGINDPERRHILDVDYDGSGRVSVYAVGDGASHFTYGQQQTEVEDPRGHTWTYGFNGTGITTEVNDPGQKTSWIALDSHNNISAFTDTLGGTWAFTYDGAARPETVTAPQTPAGVAGWTYSYASSGDLISVTNPRGIATYFTRNPQGDIVSEHEDLDQDSTIDSNEPVWQATYNSTGDVTSVTNPKGNTYQLSYNTIGFLDSVTLPCPASPCPVTRFEYTASGRVSAVHRPISEHSDATWSYEYDPLGRLTSVSDPTGFARTFTYDAAGLLSAVSDPSRGPSYFTYTDSYRPASGQAGGQSGAYEIGIGAIGGGGLSFSSRTTHFTYDESGNMISLVDAMGNETTFAYDDVNHLASRTDPLGRTWEYYHNESSNLVTVTAPNGGQTVMTYDALGALTSRTYPGGIVEEFNYDVTGNVLSVVRSQGSVVLDETVLTYDQRDLPSSLVTTFHVGSQTRVEGLAFEHDLNGNRTASRVVGSESDWVGYAYDELDHVKTLTYHGASGPEVHSFNYDPWSLRRTSFPTRGHGNAVSFNSFDPAGRPLSVTLAQGLPNDGTYEFSYENGRLSAIHKEGEQGQTMFSYDEVGELTSKSLPDESWEQFEYDDLGRMVRAHSGTDQGVTRSMRYWSFNPANELTLADLPGIRVKYSYDYATPPTGAMLRIIRERSDGSVSRKWIDVGYDARVASVTDLADDTTEAISEAFRWSPFATAQLQIWTKRASEGNLEATVLADALGGPGVSGPIAGGGLTWFDQSSVVDAYRSSPFFAPQPVRGLTNREHFALFARRSGLDPRSATSVGLGLSGPRSSVFNDVQGFLALLGRRDDSAPGFEHIEQLLQLPSPRYVDEEAQRALVPPALGVPEQLGARVSGIGARVDQSWDADLLGLSLFDGRGGILGVGTGVTSSYRDPSIDGNGENPGHCTVTHCNTYTGNDFDPIEPHDPPHGGGAYCYDPPLSLNCNECASLPMTGGPGGGGIPYGAGADRYGVNPAIGALMLSVTDLEIPWPGIGFRFTRSYRSRMQVSSDLGVGWTHNYAERIYGSSGTACSSIKWQRGDGWIGEFVRRPENYWAGPRGSHLRLLHDYDGFPWAIRLPDGELHLFDATGNLARVRDRFGNEVRFTFDTMTDTLGNPLQRLKSVHGIIDRTSGLGPEVVFEHDNHGYLRFINDCGWSDTNGDGSCNNGPSRTIEYEVSPPPAPDTFPCTGDLLSVRSPPVGAGESIVGNDYPGRTTKYEYSCHKLVSIKDPSANSQGSSGQPFQEIVYYPSSNPMAIDYERVASINLSVDGTPRRITYQYIGWVGVSLQVNVIDRLSNPMSPTTSYFYDGIGRTERISYCSNLNDHYVYDNEDRIISRRTGEICYQFNCEREAETYRYDGWGNIIEKRQIADFGAGAPDLVTRYTYDPLYSLVRSTTDPRASAGDDPTYPSEPDFDNPLVKRFTTTRYFDYQESPVTPALQNYASAWGLSDRIAASSIRFGNGAGAQQDLNGDGIMHRSTGAVVREERELWTDPDHDASGQAIDILRTLFRVNERGQPTRTEVALQDSPPVNRVTTYDYGSSGPELGQLITQTVVVDGTEGSTITTKYTHDDRGNARTITNGRGVETTYEINRLNQLWQTRRASGLDSSRGPDSSDPLIAFNYQENIAYNWNNGIAQRQVQSGSSSDYVNGYSYYDRLDRTTSVEIAVDPDGNGTDVMRRKRYLYDYEGRLTGEIKPSWGAVGYEYDRLGRKTKQRAYSKRSSDGTSLPVQDAADAMTQWTYDGQGHVLTVTDPIGRTTEMLYDGYRRLFETRRMDNGVWVREVLSYDAAGQVVRKDSYGRATVNSTASDLLSRTTLDYDELGRVVRSCAFRAAGGGAVVDHVLPLERDSCTQTWYTRAGQVDRVRDPEGRVTTFTYDRAGRKNTVRDARGNTIQFTYDKAGNVVETRSAELDSDGTVRTYITRSKYDSLDRLEKTIVQPDDSGNSVLGIETSYEYDARGNITGIIDPEGHRTEKQYNQANELTESRLCRVGLVDCSGPNQFEERVQYEYDVDGLVFRQRDGEGHVTEFWYDQLGRKVAVKYPDGTGLRWEFDKAGQAIFIKRQKVLAAGSYNRDQHVTNTSSLFNTCPSGTSGSTCIVESITYDDLGRILDRGFTMKGTAIPGYAGTNHQFFRYDGLSRILSTTDENGTGTADDVVVTRLYDTLSRVVSESQGIGVDSRTIDVGPPGSSDYDKTGFRLELRYFSGFQASFTSDELHRLSSVAAGGSPVATHYYAGPGLLQRRDYGNGVSLDQKIAGWAYDAAKRITHVRVLQGTGNPDANVLVDLEYGYDHDSLRTFERRLHDVGCGGGTCPGQRYEYTFSGGRAAHRLESYQAGDIDSNGALVGTIDRGQTQSYDTEGNWLGVIVTGGPHAGSFPNSLVGSGEGNGMNQYSRFKTSSSSANWSYTFAGDLIGDGQRTYRYDYLHRLIQVSDGASVLAEYAYDAENRRIEKRLPAGGGNWIHQVFTYDGWRVLEEFLGASSTPIQRYIWANGSDRLLAFERYEGSIWKRYFVHADALGSTRAVTDENQLIRAQFVYGAFGEEFEATGDLALAIPYRYTGQRLDDESGLYYFKNRYYLPDAGRFLTRDPAGYVDGSNVYRYARNAPSILTDPLGLSSGKARDGRRGVYSESSAQMASGDAAVTASSTGVTSSYDVNAPVTRTTTKEWKRTDGGTGETTFFNTLDQALGKQQESGGAQPPITIRPSSDEGSAEVESTIAAMAAPTTPGQPASQTAASSHSSAQPTSKAKVDNKAMDKRAGAEGLVARLKANPDGTKTSADVATKAQSGTPGAKEVEVYLVEKSGSVQLYEPSQTAHPNRPSGEALTAPFSRLSAIARDCNCTVFSIVLVHPLVPGVRGSGGLAAPQDYRENLERMGATSGLVITPKGIFYYTRTGGNDQTALSDSPHL